MKIILKGGTIKTVAAILTDKEKENFKSQHRWHNDKIELDISPFCDKSIQAIHDILDKEAKEGGSNARSAALSRGQVKQWQDIKKNPAGEVVTKLKNLPSLIKAFVGTSENRYLFRQLGDGNSAPYFVVNSVYSPARDFSPAQVSVTLAAHNSFKSGGYYSTSRNGSSASITFFEEDYRGKTVAQMLQAHSYFLETPERMAEYEKEMTRFMMIRGMDGHQVNVVGKAISTSNWYGREFRSVEKGGQPAKMVVDPKEDEASTVISATTSQFWEDKGAEHLWDIPYHPFVRVFDLDDHTNLRAHINNISAYQYDTNVGDKLVLDDDTKELLEILVMTAADSFEDIVSGKQGGSIILCAGKPGVGKTLTAEVYSEVMERPLYRVQSSQLGISVSALEDELKKVLQRAERWGAILLIDEADVYVRSRGDEIEQNAIVGVFLRVLEYYRGVLFMTTNRSTDIDDAIVSRLTARIDYEMPGEEQQAELWKILSEQNGVKLSNAELAKILANHPQLSGRDIKNLLKLAARVANAKGEKVSAEIIKKVSKFKQVSRPEE
jgi:hypothetical protein